MKNCYRWRDCINWENDTWKLVSRPKRKKQIDIEWIYKKKKNIKGEVKRYKVKLVVKCYTKKYGIDNYHSYPI